MTLVNEITITFSFYNWLVYILIILEIIFILNCLMFIF